MSRPLPNFGKGRLFLITERARAARVDDRVVVWPHMWHVFQMHAPVMPEARESIRQLGKFISGRLA